MNKQEGDRLRAVLSLVFSALASLTGIALASILFMLALPGIVFGAPAQALIFISSSTAFLLLGLGALPSVFQSYRALTGGAALSLRPSKRTLYAVAAGFPVWLLIGHLAFTTTGTFSLWGPLAHVLAAVSPASFVLALTASVHFASSEPRYWLQTTMGLWLVPMSALIAEIGAILILALLFLVRFFQSGSLQPLLDRLDSLEVLDEVELLSALEPMLEQPGVVVAILIFVLLLVPLIEEGLKTMTIWPFVRRGLTPAQAFSGGVIAGVGFGLVEALFLTQTNAEWSLTVIARAGATMMHAFTAGVSCWGISLIRQNGLPRTLFRYYGLAVMMHALWNTAAIGTGIGVLLLQGQYLGVGRGFASAISVLSVFVLIALSAIAVVRLHRISDHLTPRAEPKDHPEQASQT
jgi:hypothetical protein